MYFVQFEVTQGKVNVTSDLRIITKQLNFVLYSAITFQTYCDLL